MTMEKEKRNPSEIKMTKSEGERIIFCLDNIRKTITKEIARIRRIVGGE